MTLEGKWMIFLFFGIHMSYFKAEVLTVPDPCPEITPTTKVADMCRQNEAVEEGDYGNDNFDSVALRIMPQEDNCTCLVTIDNQSNNYVMYIKKYNDINSAVPLVSNCGLEIDMDYPNPEKPIQPISCSKTALPLSFPLIQNGVLTLTSKIINGNFQNGYCLQIIRENINFGNPILRVVCAEQGLIPSLSIPQSTRSGSDVSTTEISTNSSIVSTDVSKSADTTNNLQVDNARAADIYPKETSFALYIGVGCGVAGAIVLIIIVIFIVCKRKSHKRRLKKTENESATTQDRPEDPSYGLTDNILYVTSEQSASPEGDYTCIGAENPVSKEDDDLMLHLDGNTTYKISFNNQRDSNQNDNSIIYAVVDKIKRNQHQNTSQIYAIVDKDTKHNKSVEQSNEQQ